MVKKITSLSNLATSPKSIVLLLSCSVGNTDLSTILLLESIDKNIAIVSPAVAVLVKSTAFFSVIVIGVDTVAGGIPVTICPSPFVISIFLLSAVVPVLS